MIRAAAAMSFLLLAAQTLLAQASPQLTPAEILARVSSVYGCGRTYSDREGARHDLFNHSRRPDDCLSGEELLARSKLDWENRMNAQKELLRLKNLPWKKPSPPSDDFLARNAARWTQLHIGVVQMAKATGGWADYLEKPEQAEGLYAYVLNDINERYVLAYSPKNRARDGKRRKVS